MTPEDHQAEHVRLHRALDELMACYLEEGFVREDSGGKRASIHDEIYSLMRWSHQKSLAPSPVDRAALAQEFRHAKPEQLLVAQSDDPELLEWLAKAAQEGGSFVQGIASAALHADPQNYALIRTLLLVLRQKYPTYEPSDAVKEEIRNRPKETAQ
jgi:hypothetical protein